MGFNLRGRNNSVGETHLSTLPVTRLTGHCGRAEGLQTALFLLPLINTTDLKSLHMIPCTNGRLDPHEPQNQSLSAPLLSE